ncbi:uncharacterized protein [Brachionichthys hirsutus]|uniref:uncharacterized protein n=1 Tax=Brachionichthys hirsutus TaxID=412623 RepID=UPI00360525CB
MPSQAASGTVLLALWVALGRCVPPAGPGCDNGKLYLDRDLPDAAVHWECPTSPWTATRHPSVDTVHHPERVRLICMDQDVSYNRSIPNSGAHRPIRAESGEYLYCPPQRWINNLHHAATVLLFHPCAPSQERRLLSVLGRSCLSNYVLTPHHQLSQQRPIALVSWARTLELSTVAVSDACDWLETTTSTSNGSGGVRPSWRYDYLLTRSAEQEPEEPPGSRKEAVRRCCQEVITKSNREAKVRPVRAEHNNGTIRDVQNLSRTLGPPAGSPPGNRTTIQSNTQNTDRPRPAGSDALRTQSPNAGPIKHGHPSGTGTRTRSSKYEASDPPGVLKEARTRR